MSTDTATVGRRERHKARTRAQLQAAARRLFAEQGYAATTVQQIAEAADVSERTLFRYFESKEDLLLPDVVALFAGVEQVIGDRPLDEPPLDSILEGFVQAATAPAADGLSLVAPGIDPADPLVVGRFGRAFVDWEDRLADVLYERFRAAGADGGTTALRLHASVVARAATSAVRATLRLAREEAARGAADMHGGGTPRPGGAGAFLVRLRTAFAMLAEGCPNPVPTRTGDAPRADVGDRRLHGTPPIDSGIGNG